MRITISLLVTTFIFGSLAIELQNTAVVDSGSLQMVVSKAKLGAKPKQPKERTPYRGSGRGLRLMEYFNDTQFQV